MKLTKREREIAARFGKEDALKHDGAVYLVNGRTVAHADEVERMAVKGAVEFEQVGGSRFARLSHSGRTALAPVDPAPSQSEDGKEKGR